MLKAIKKEINDSSTKTLKDAIEEDFDSVFIFGYKDGLMHYRSSKVKSRHELMGAMLEAVITMNDA